MSLADGPQFALHDYVDAARRIEGLEPVATALADARSELASVEATDLRSEGPALDPAPVRLAVEDRVKRRGRRLGRLRAKADAAEAKLGAQISDAEGRGTAAA